MLRKRWIKTITVFVTIVAFTVSLVPLDIVWAARTRTELTSVGSDTAVAGGSGTKELRPETFMLPPHLGFVRDSWTAPKESIPRQARDELPQKVVIHIQDAHCVYQAQRSIARIVEYLAKRYGVNTVYLEGGEGQYDISSFTGIADTARREKAADRILREGMINGAEYYAVMNPGEVELIGAENTRLYMENLSIYRQLLPEKPRIDWDIATIENEVVGLRSKIYSDDLMRLELRREDYLYRKIDIRDYLNYLLKVSEKCGAGIEMYVNLRIFFEVLKEEAAIDFKRSDSERDQLIDILTKRLSKYEVEEFVKKAVQFKTREVDPAEFYSYVITKAGEADIDLHRYPLFLEYAAFTEHYASIRIDELIKETEQFEDAIRQRLFTNGDQRALAKLVKDIVLLKEIFNITVTPERLAYYKLHKDEINFYSITDMVSALSAKYRGERPALPDPAFLSDRLRFIEGFYESSNRRDFAFVEKILASSAAGRSILLTGGFHTAHLTEVLKESNISYISIVPRFALDQTPNNYTRLLAGKRPPLYELIAKDMSLISLYTYQCAKTDEVYGPYARETFSEYVGAVAGIETEGKSTVDTLKEMLILSTETDKRNQMPELMLGDKDIYVTRQAKGPSHMKMFRLKGSKNAFNVEDKFREIGSWDRVPLKEAGKYEIKMVKAERDELVRMLGLKSDEDLKKLVSQSVDMLKKWKIDPAKIAQKIMLLSLIDSDKSRYLFEDCENNSFIGINRDLAKIGEVNPELAQLLFVVGIAHELRHEAGVADERESLDYDHLAELLMEKDIAPSRLEAVLAKIIENSPKIVEKVIAARPLFLAAKPVTPAPAAPVVAPTGILAAEKWRASGPYLAGGKRYSIKTTADNNEINKAFDKWFGAGRERAFGRSQWTGLLEQAISRKQPVHFMTLESESGEILAIKLMHRDKGYPMFRPGGRVEYLDMYVGDYFEVDAEYRGAGLGEILMAKSMEQFAAEIGEGKTANLRDLGRREVMVVHPAEDSSYARRGRQARDFFARMGFVKCYNPQVDEAVEGVDQFDQDDLDKALYMSISGAMAQSLISGLELRYYMPLAADRLGGYAKFEAMKARPTANEVKELNDITRSIMQAVIDGAKDRFEPHYAIKVFIAAVNESGYSDRMKNIILSSIRGVLSEGAAGKIRPEEGYPLNVVLQFTPADVAAPAQAKAGEGDRALKEEGYGLNTKSIVGRADHLKEMLERALTAMKDAKAARTFVYLPISLKARYEELAAKDKIFADGRIRVQYIDDTADMYPDIVTRLVLGVKFLDFDRRSAEGKRAMPQELLNLIAAVTDQDPREVLSNLFRKDFVFRIKKIDFSTIDEWKAAQDQALRSL